MRQTEYITSRNNEKIKYAVKLRDSSSFRYEVNEFIIEGARLCSDAAESGMSIKICFVTEKALSKYKDYIGIITEKADNIYCITDEVCTKLSDTKTSQGVFCICKMLDKKANIGKIKQNGKFVALEDVVNPQNFGAVCRTAEALGLDGIITGGGCDIYNPKAQRASMGSLFRMNIFVCDDFCGDLKKLQSCGMKIYATVPDGSALPITKADMKNGVVTVIGNEGNGVSEKCKTLCDEKITIPMKGRAESFNASAAASIAMWEMMR